MVDSDVWLAIAGRCAASIHNFEQHRRYEASLVKRKEGFTEHWGDANRRTSSGTVWKRLDAGGEQDLLATPYPQSPLVLFQYRPAWEEQLALRIGGIEHVVVNSSYAVTEATGPLPMLRDLTPASPPVLTGRKQPRSLSNAILDHLKERHGLDLDGSLSEADRHTSALYASLITDNLQPAMEVLGVEWHAQEQVYRHQARAASQSRWAWQIWSERIFRQRQLSSAQRQWTVEQAVQKAKDTFSILEDRLKSNLYLLPTDEPSTADVLLFGALARALADVHLVVVLADFPNLCSFIQLLWDAYFAGDETSSSAWRQWNLEQNAANAFGQMPFLTTPSAELTHAAELMQQLSLVNHDLHQRLVLARSTRAHENKTTKWRPLATWHRWRFGDELFPEPPAPSMPEDPQEEKTKREYRRNDELWIMTLVVSSAATILLFGLAEGRSP